MRVMVYRGASGCRVIVEFHKPAWSRQPRPLSRTRARPSPACRPAPLSDSCDLRLRTQGHDLQLPYL